MASVINKVFSGLVTVFPTNNMIKDMTYYELRLAKLIANGETMNARLINKVKRKIRALKAAAAF